MDANGTIDGLPNGLTCLIAKTNLVYAVSRSHSKLPHTYLRGSRRVDFILVTPSLLPHFRKYGHLGIQDGIPSEHCNLWMELDSHAIFQGATTSLASLLSKPSFMQEI